MKRRTFLQFITALSIADQADILIPVDPPSPCETDFSVMALNKEGTRAYFLEGQIVTIYSLTFQWDLDKGVVFQGRYLTSHILVDGVKTPYGA